MSFDFFVNIGTAVCKHHIPFYDTQRNVGIHYVFNKYTHIFGDFFRTYRVCILESATTPMTFTMESQTTASMTSGATGTSGSFTTPTVSTVSTVTTTPTTDTTGTFVPFW